MLFERIDFIGYLFYVFMCGLRNFCWGGGGLKGLFFFWGKGGGYIFCNFIIGIE